METYSIRCHCKRIHAKFRCEKHRPLTVWDCNCSDCGMRRNLHFMVPARDFWLERVTTATAPTAASTDSATADGGTRAAAADGTDRASTAFTPLTVEQHFEQETILYQWGTKTAIRRFCKTCGILPFYIARSNSDGYAITYPCVDWGEDGPLPTETQRFDGVHWEESQKATGISKETV